MSYFQGFTHEEISKILDIPLGTVKTRYKDTKVKEIIKKNDLPDFNRLISFVKWLKKKYTYDQLAQRTDCFFQYRDIAFLAILKENPLNSG